MVHEPILFSELVNQQTDWFASELAKLQNGQPSQYGSLRSLIYQVLDRGARWHQEKELEKINARAD